jgi:hypothetical protein
MMSPETELEMVQRHVREGGRLVANQREMLAHIRKHGYRDDLAKTLLESFEDVQKLHEEHLARLTAARPERPDLADVSSTSADAFRQTQ